MNRAEMNGIELEYEITGSGDPVLMIGTGPIADSFLPLQSERALATRYRLIRYRQRGQVSCSPVAGPVSFVEHAADAAALLNHLCITRAHVVGHSTGAAIALQLAADDSDMVQSLTLLEPPLMSVPGAAAFLDRAGPSIASYVAGNREAAMTSFLSMVCTLDWDACQAVLEARIPRGVEHAIANADVFFGSYLPALGAWQFGAEQAAALRQPVLSVLGTDTDELFVESHEVLRSWFSQLEESVIDDVGHLLHLQRATPVAEQFAGFLGRHSMMSQRTAGLKAHQGLVSG